MFECRSWLHISPPSTPFSISKTQNSRVDSNQESTWMVKSSAWTTHCSHCSAVNACGTNHAQNFVFSNHRTECGERWFSVSRTLRYHPITSTAVVLQNSYHPSGDVFVVPSLPLLFASSIDSSPTANRLCHQNTVTRDTGESPNTFTNISHIFAAVNPTLQQNFITARCSKFFSMIIYNTSTKHTAKRSYTATYRQIDFKLDM